MRVECPGVVVTGAVGEPLCLEVGTAEPVEWQPLPDAYLSVESAAQAFSVGFMVVATCWGLGKGVALVLRLVK